MAFDAINLDRLPAPDIVETLSHREALEGALNELRARYPEFSALLESDPVIKLLEVFAYREVLLRERVNEAARACMLAYALGADLDNLAALFGLARAPGQPDDQFRRSVQLAPEGATAAGTEGTYSYHALTADPAIADVKVEADGVATARVSVTVLPHAAAETDGAALLQSVREALEPRRVTTDLLSVRLAEVVPFQIQAELVLQTGPDPSVVLATARAALNDLLVNQRRLGRLVSRSAIMAALHQPGVLRVELTKPAADVAIGSSQVAECTAIAIEGQVDDG